jgi:transposase
LIEARRLRDARNPHEDTGIATPPALLHLIARGVARAGLLARVVTVKHEDLLPL